MRLLQFFISIFVIFLVYLDSGSGYTHAGVISILLAMAVGQGVLSYVQAEKARKKYEQSESKQKEAYNIIRNINDLDPNLINQVLPPEEAKRTLNEAYGQADAGTGRQGQDDALRRFQELADKGFTDKQKADLELARFQNADRARAERERIRSQERGLGTAGSGRELLRGSLNQQSQQRNNEIAALQQLGASAQAKQTAITGLAGTAGQIAQQDYGRARHVGNSVLGQKNKNVDTRNLANLRAYTENKDNALNRAGGARGYSGFLERRGNRHHDTAVNLGTAAFNTVGQIGKTAEQAAKAAAGGGF